MFDSFPGFALIIPSTPTCYRDSYGSFIDFVVVSDELAVLCSNMQTIPSFSDHPGFSLPVNISLSKIDPNNVHGLYLYNYTKVKPLNTFLNCEHNKLNMPHKRNLKLYELELLTNNIDKSFSEAFHKYTY